MVCKVVSVEDEPEIAELLRVVLQNPELELHSADNADDGLTLIRRIKPDLVILDVMMPGEMNGWDIYDHVRADEAFKNMPIIMLSVMHERPERRQAFRNSSVDLYLNKPFDTMQLRSEIERLLDRPGLWPPPKPPVARVFGAFLNAEKALKELQTLTGPDTTKPDPASPASPDQQVASPDDKV
jgi:DNA-binding response OmpR family regulator